MVMGLLCEQVRWVVGQVREGVEQAVAATSPSSFEEQQQPQPGEEGATSSEGWLLVSKLEHRVALLADVAASGPTGR